MAQFVLKLHNIGLIRFQAVKNDSINLKPYESM